jgi:hypothetical protein
LFGLIKGVLKVEASAEELQILELCCGESLWETVAGLFHIANG